MLVDDALDDAEADTGALEFLRVVQALEDAEQPVAILRLETNSVVPDRADAFVPGHSCADLDLRKLPRACELDGVRQQVEQHLADGGRIAPDVRQPGGGAPD